MMKTKTGERVPIALQLALENIKGARAAWNTLRPSCQLDFIERVERAPDEDARDRIVDALVMRTLKYAAEHKTDEVIV